MTAFSLPDAAGVARTFPNGRPTLICFVKADCPTCTLAVPVLEAFHRAFGAACDVVLLDQTAGPEGFSAREDLSLPILDETGCRVSFETDIEIVPTLIWTDGAGAVTAWKEGFVRDEWESLGRTLARDLGAAPAPVNWATLPEWRVGCGSKHLDPDLLPRLEAQAEGSPLQARQIAIGSADDVQDFMFDQGFSDGLPLVPPTPDRVMRMLAGTRRGAQEVVAVVPPNMGEATVEKIAINAVMAGCKPDYLPVVIAALEAVCTDAFNIHGVMATTMGAAPVMVVNGPIRHRIGMNMTLGALGQGNRANATIGRALRLVVRNVGGAKPGGTERATLSNPMKFTMCFAEWEERNPWTPLHVERGYAAGASVVTLFAMTSGPTLIVDQESREPDQIAGSLGLGLEGVFLPKLHALPVDALLVVCPEHVDTLMKDGAYTKERLRSRIQEVTRKPLRAMIEDSVSGAGLKRAAAAQYPPERLDAPIPKFASDDFIHIVVAGSDAGKFSGAFHGWATGEIGSVSVSQRIED
ncbi:MAG: peroxiredoxin family protein [Alphaproteobacteria bacterium]